MSETRSTETPGWANLALAVVALVCVALSVYLTHVHLVAHYTDALVGGLCNLSAKINCNVAAASAFAQVGEVPVAVLGMGFYLAALVGTIAFQFRPQAMRYLPNFLVALFGLSCVYSVFLGAISAFVLGSICWACTSLYVLHVVALILARLVAREGYLASLRTLYRNLIPATFSPSGAVLVIVFSITVAVATWVSGELGESMAGGNDTERKAQAEAFLRDEFLPTPPLDEATWREAVQGPALGPADAPVTIVEFSDFECPFCARLGPELEGIQRDSGGKVRLVFRHLPLDQACNPSIKRPFHKHACDGARAAICADAQGRFWPMHDDLFAHQRELAPEQIKERAQGLGLDLPEFNRCLAAPELSPLTNDLELARRLGLRGTPVTLINGRKLSGAKPRWLLDAIVEHELRQSSGGGNR